MKKLVLAGLLLFSANLAVGTDSHAEDNRIAVPWKPSTLVDGQIGRITLLADTNLVKHTGGDQFSQSRTLKKGEIYRVYSFKYSGKYYYGVGAGFYIPQASTVKYETPAALKKKQLLDFKYVNKELTTLAAKNILEGQPFSIGTTRYNDVKNYYKDNAVFGTREGGKTITANGYTYAAPLLEENGLINSVSWKNQFAAPYTPEVIQQRLGKPVIAEYSELTGQWNMRYNAGKRTLIFEFEKIKNSKGIVSNILLK